MHSTEYQIRLDNFLNHLNKYNFYIIEKTQIQYFYNPFKINIDGWFYKVLYKHKKKINFSTICDGQPYLHFGSMVSLPFKDMTGIWVGDGSNFTLNDLNHMLKWANNEEYIKQFSVLDPHSLNYMGTST